MPELLGEPDENAFGTPDVAAPIYVFILGHFADERRACPISFDGAAALELETKFGENSMAASMSSTTMPTLSMRLTVMMSPWRLTDCRSAAALLSGRLQR
ncbi:MAG TPA: hypothetical protein VFH97_09785, partial [Gemmatimonadales bacterium]|nr:hypothetical protein [Gemmatimonadales bacterium]